MWNYGVPESPTLYHIEVTLGEGQNIVDRYALQTGENDFHNDKQLLLNGKPLMLRGFGRHEDFAIFGGHSQPCGYQRLWTDEVDGSKFVPYIPLSLFGGTIRFGRPGRFSRDRWDPAVGLYFFDDPADVAARKKVCEQYLLECRLVIKSSSVIIWSVANEPNPKNMGSRAPKSDNQAEETGWRWISLVRWSRQAKAFDDSRPASFVGVMGGPMEWLSLAISRWSIVITDGTRMWFFDTGMKYLSMELTRSIPLMPNRLSWLNSVPMPFQEFILWMMICSRKTFRPRWYVIRFKCWSQRLR